MEALRITRLPQELFSAQGRTDQFYRSVARYLTVEEVVAIYFFGSAE